MLKWVPLIMGCIAMLCVFEMIGRNMYPRNKKKNKL